MKAQRDKFLTKVKELAAGREVQCGGRPVQYHFLLTILFQQLTLMYKTWANKNILTPADLAKYTAALQRFIECWLAFQWKPAVWVHWICAHSTFFLNQEKSLSAFSSIPTEYRHQNLSVTCGIRPSAGNSSTPTIVGVICRGSSNSMPWIWACGCWIASPPPHLRTSSNPLSFHWASRRMFE